MKALLAAAVLLAAPARAALVENWTTRTVDGETFDVFEVRPAEGASRLPAVLVLHNNVDGVSPWIKEQARKIAREGYVVAAPALTQPSELGGIKDAIKLPRATRAAISVSAGKRAAAALKLLQRDPRVEPGHVGAVGFCHLGGPAAMDLARTGAGVASVATFWGGVSPTDLSNVWGRRTLKPKILVLLGGSDVETNPYLPAFEEEMRLGKADWRLVLYGTATHAFNLPGDHPGGRGVYDPDADRRSWAQLKAFLEETLKPARTGKPG